MKVVESLGMMAMIDQLPMARRCRTSQPPVQTLIVRFVPVFRPTLYSAQVICLDVAFGRYLTDAKTN